jgi:DNA polymerase
MAKRTLSRSAAEFLPAKRDLISLRKAAAGCRGCELYKLGTQTVFGEGAARASVMLVGEQPGDKEDLAGRPFVGPAGGILDKALDAAGIDRGGVYVTNAVKHFKWEPRGKRRIHKKPNGLEIAACHPWFEAEVEAVKPDVIVCLGATAAQSILGAKFRVTQMRGRVVHVPGLPTVIATVHPSSILRAQTDEERHAQMAEFVADMKSVAATLRKRAA